MVLRFFLIFYTFNKRFCEDTDDDCSMMNRILLGDALYDIDGFLLMYIFLALKKNKDYIA